MNFFKNLHTRKVRKRINKLDRKIQSIIDKSKFEFIEFCNIKKTKIWGIDEKGFINWKYQLEVLSHVPMIYEIHYNSHLKSFTAASPKAAMNAVRKFPRIKTENLQTFIEKFEEFVSSLPIIRERILREYLFAVMKQKSRRKFLKKFIRSSKKEEFLTSIIDSMYEEKKISKRELEMMKNYIPNVIT